MCAKQNVYPFIRMHDVDSISIIEINGTENAKILRCNLKLFSVLYIMNEKGRFNLDYSRANCIYSTKTIVNN